MYTKLFVLVFVAAACNANVVPAPSQPVYCGEIPLNIFSCAGLPSLFTDAAVGKCKETHTPCAKLTCLFTEVGCMSAGAVDKQKARQYFDSFLETHAVWSQAVNHAKAACLGDKTLPAQGAYLDCPAFDILHCALTSFIKNVPVSQWQQSPQCEQTRRFAESCPLCPSECFAKQVPSDSCHACLALPRSA